MACVDTVSDSLSANSAVEVPGSNVSESTAEAAALSETETSV